MRSSIAPLSLVVAAAMTLSMLPLAFAAESKEPIPESRISLQTIKALLSQSDIMADFDSDGDLMVPSGGMKTFFKLDPHKKLVTIFSAWKLKDRATQIQKLQLVNDLNNRLVVVRFCVPRENMLWCDYQFSYESGISPYRLVQNYHIFVKVVKGAVATQDPDNIIGEN